MRAGIILALMTTDAAPDQGQPTEPTPGVELTAEQQQNLLDSFEQIAQWVEEQLTYLGDGWLFDQEAGRCHRAKCPRPAIFREKRGGLGACAKHARSRKRNTLPSFDLYSKVRRNRAEARHQVEAKFARQRAKEEA